MLEVLATAVKQEKEIKKQSIQLTKWMQDIHSGVMLRKKPES